MRHPVCLTFHATLTMRSKERGAFLKDIYHSRQRAGRVRARASVCASEASLLSESRPGVGVHDLCGSVNVNMLVHLIYRGG